VHPIAVVGLPIVIIPNHHLALAKTGIRPRHRVAEFVKPDDPILLLRPRVGRIDDVTSVLSVAPNPLTLTERVVEQYMLVVSALWSVVIYDDPTGESLFLISHF
jgi:hypothetical protein